MNVTVELPIDHIDALKELAEARGVSMTKALEIAVGTEHYLSSKIASGAKILIQEPNGYLKELVFQQKADWNIRPFKTRKK